ncbi:MULTISPECIES: cupin domain-containing protein [Streptomyces]|uniref:cupin domain-containing protein n=1 Tax=Streptomyces TaxID=1883 RepID=UPI001F37F4AA|nr:MULTISPECIES: cupin domain-containing protein [Streptomyces]
MTQPRAAKVAAADVAPNIRRGGDVRTLLTPRSVGATSGFMGTATIEPGQYIAEHYHPYSEEFVHVVRGRLRVRLDGEPVDVRPGEALFVPIGVRHRLENTGDEQVSVVFHLGPLAPRPDLGHVDTEELPHPDAPHGGAAPADPVTGSRP